MLNQLRVKSKFMLLLLCVSLAPIAAVGSLGWQQAKAIREETVFNQLTSLRAARSDQIEAYFDILKSHTATLSEDQMVVSALVDFNASFYALNQLPTQPAWDEVLKEYYTQQFFPNLVKNVAGEPSFETYRPVSPAARYLQYHYLVQGAGEPCEATTASLSAPARSELPEAGDVQFNQLSKNDVVIDQSDYGQVHSRYHSRFCNLIRKFGYRNLFLIDAKTGDIVYSVRKETDFGSSLNTGSYRQSSLAEIVNVVRSSSEQGSVQLIDFKPYRPAYGEPLSFVASPIYNGPQLVGILAIQIAADEIGQILAGDQGWAAAGLGKTGEAYLVGSDYLMRSDLRALQENKQGYLYSLQATGASENTTRLMDRLNTSVLLQTADMNTVRAAIGGATGQAIGRNYRAKEVFSAYGPLQIDGLTWAILVEMESSEVYLPVHLLQGYMLIAAAVVMLVTTLLAAIVAGRFTKPMRAMTMGTHPLSDATKEELAAELAATLTYQDEFGDLARTFHATQQTLQQQTERLLQKEHENETLLLNILPAPIVERLKSGDSAITQSLPQVSVLFVRIGGLTKLATQRNAADIRQLLSDLVAAFDERALLQDVERIGLLGEQYVAVCGLNKQRLDHTKRLMDFALDILVFFKDFNKTWGTHLTLHLGMHTGASMAGIIGSRKFAYNLWGETVTVAGCLVNHAQTSAILVSSEVHSRLKDLHNFESGPAILIEDQGKVDTWILSNSWLKDLIGELTLSLEIDDEPLEQEREGRDDRQPDAMV